MYCSYCGREVNEHAVVCIHCGCAIKKVNTYDKIERMGGKTEMKYCANCGKELVDGAVVCVGCGCAVDESSILGDAGKENKLMQLSSRIRINGIIWVCIACIQIFYGLYFSWWTLVVGVLNIITAVQDLKYSSDMLNNPINIIKNHESLTGPIIVLVYNLFFGGIIGVAGSIYYLIAVRNFVISDKGYFSRFDKNI